MSGGHFGDCGYDYYKVAQFADELEQEILNNGRGKHEDQTYGQEWYPEHEPQVIEYLKQQLPKMRKMVEIMRHIDYLYSGDHGDDTFMKRVEEVERKYTEVDVGIYERITEALAQASLEYDS
jgi:hypothetical protein